MTDKDLLYVIHEAFARIQKDDPTKDLKVFPNQDGLPFFEFIITGEDGGKFKITYALPVLVFRKLAEKNLGSYPLKSDAIHHPTKVLAVAAIQNHAVFLMRAAEASFRQSVADIPILVEKLQQLADRQQSERAERFWNQASTGFSFDKASKELANEFGENQKRSGKDLFLKAAAFLPEDLPHKRLLFAIYHESLLKTWQSAKKIYTKNKKHPDWRKMIAGVHDELPLDLIEKLDALKGEEKSPSDLALIHSARMCEIDEKCSRSTLNLYLKQSREWLKEREKIELEKILDDYRVPENMRPGVININSLRAM